MTHWILSNKSRTPTFQQAGPQPSEHMSVVKGCTGFWTSRGWLYNGVDGRRPTGTDSPCSLTTTWLCGMRRHQWCNGLKNVKVSISFNRKLNQINAYLDGHYQFPAHFFMILCERLKVSKEIVSLRVWENKWKIMYRVESLMSALQNMSALQPKL